MMAALARPGVDAVLTRDGATDAAVCRADGEPGVGPPWVPGAIVILDNLRARNVAGRRERMEACGAPLIDVPPDTPARSPMEPSWAQRKPLVRTAPARTRAAIAAALAPGVAAVTPSEARGWFRHCGYPVRSLENRSKIPNLPLCSLKRPVSWSNSGFSRSLV
jgi:hypothetical protein